METLDGPGTHLSRDMVSLQSIYARSPWMGRVPPSSPWAIPQDHAAASLPTLEAGSRAASTPKHIANILMKDLSSLQLK